MTELLTAAQMRAIEQAAIDSGEVTGLELMERAGRGVVEAIFEEWPDLAKTSHKAVVLCGPGNNGGDGFVVARLLKDWGWEVEVFLYGDAEKLPVDARMNYERWCELGAVSSLKPTIWEEHAFPGICDIVVDALFGTGLRRPIDLPLEILTATPEVGQSHRVIAIDIPSGLCSDSGRAIGDEVSVVWADLTVTFHRAKIGHFQIGGPDQCGKLVVVSLWNESINASQEMVNLEELVGTIYKNSIEIVRKVDFGSDAVKHVISKSSGHKFSYGHALTLSGGVGEGGAARMSARGALRIGAGLVTVGCPPAALQENAARLDAIMLRSIKDGDALAEMLGDERINALCLGPGLGVNPEKAELLSVVLGNGGVKPRPTVLDADALTLLAGDAELFGKLHDSCVLTPHGGEFARLFPDIAEKLDAPAMKGPAYSKVEATREAAARAGCVVLFKGADTVIASPDGRCSINSAHYERSAPWLATAGSGDVLAGFITGLVARGFSPMQAAETGAWLHVECARKFGPGLIAEDLPEQLPAVFRDLGL